MRCKVGDCVSLGRGHGAQRWHALRRRAGTWTGNGTDAAAVRRRGGLRTTRSRVAVAGGVTVGRGERGRGETLAECELRRVHAAGGARSEAAAVDAAAIEFTSRSRRGNSGRSGGSGRGPTPRQTQLHWFTGSRTRIRILIVAQRVTRSRLSSLCAIASSASDSYRGLDCEERRGAARRRGQRRLRDRGHGRRQQRQRRGQQ